MQNLDEIGYKRAWKSIKNLAGPESKYLLQRFTGLNDYVFCSLICLAVLFIIKFLIFLVEFIIFAMKLIILVGVCVIGIIRLHALSKQQVAAVKKTSQSSKKHKQCADMTIELAGENIAFLGKFSTVSREDLRLYIEQKGGKVVKTAQKSTIFVILGKEIKESSIQRLKNLKISTITEKEFLNGFQVLS